MSTAGSTERYHAFKLRHETLPGELIHYVGSPCSVEEIEQQLEKNVVTHVFSNGAWKKVERSDR